MRKKLVCTKCQGKFKVLNPDRFIFSAFICQVCMHYKCRICGQIDSNQCKRCKRCTRCRCTCEVLSIGDQTARVPAGGITKGMYCSCCNKPKTLRAYTRFIEGHNTTPATQAALDRVKICKCRNIRSALPPTSTLFKKKTFLVNSSRRSAGFEIELADWGHGWSMELLRDRGYEQKRDTSVLPSGRELVSPPMAGDTLIAEPLWLWKFLKEKECAVNDSCGLHVHVGAQDFSDQSLRNLLITWAALEDDILRHLCDASRRNNTDYCRRVLEYPNASTMLAELVSSKSTSAREVVQRMLFGGNIPSNSRSEYRNNHYHSSRYYALNLHSLFYRGTVEFRCKEGVLDAEHALGWIMFCLQFVDTSHRLRQRDLYDIVNDRSILHFVHKYMPTWLANWATSTSEIFTQAGSEVSLMRHVTRSPRVPVPGPPCRNQESTYPPDIWWTNNSSARLQPLNQRIPHALSYRVNNNNEMVIEAVASVEAEQRLAFRRQLEQDAALRPATR